MANLKLDNKWNDGFYQLETTDPVMGGEDGIDNLQAKQLGANIFYIRGKGIAEWANNITYSKHGLVNVNGELYISLVDNNLNIAITDSTKWAKLITQATISTSGVVKLNNATNSTSTTEAATANAVKVTMEKASSAATAATNAQNTANIAKSTAETDASTTVKGRVQLNSAINSTVENQAATPMAVKTAYDLANKAKSTAETDASTTVKGRVQLNSAINSTVENQAATPKAIKTLSDKINAFTSGVYVGEMRLFPFRSTELPSGWYFCNGSNVTTSSNIGQKLQSLSANFKSDWGIKVSGSNINLPNLLNTNDGGYFLRPVDGVSRKVGSIQSEGLPNITGSVDGLTQGNNGTPLASGSFKATNSGNVWQSGTSNGFTKNKLDFDASKSNQIYGNSQHVTPINIGMTPAIYLGV